MNSDCSPDKQRNSLERPTAIISSTHPMKRIIFFLKGSSPLVMAAILTGCTIVKIRNGDADVTHVHFGIAQVNISPKVKLTTTTTESIGIAYGASKTSIGWLQETAVFTNSESECHAIFFLHDEYQAERVSKTFRDLGNLCISHMGTQ